MMNVSGPIMAVATALLLTGCIGLSFKEEAHITNRHVSVGTELIDLRTAYDEGLLNDEEYEAARQEILKQGKPDETAQTEKQEKEGEQE